VTKNQFKDKIKEIMLELLKDYELDEITTTGDVAGYSTPFAFKKKKKKKKAGFDGGHGKPDVFGFSVVNEELSQQDVVQIRKLIKGILNDMFRDIWLKRNAWNRI
tara:strand:+ start:1188 stop:1502 length:315 start_codon:yes stop_codon:yes gene_type:complete